MAEAGAPVKGRTIDDVGYYNPHTSEFSVNKESVQEWLAKGTQASPTVHNLLINNKVIEGKKVRAWKAKHKEKVEEK